MSRARPSASVRHRRRRFPGCLVVAGIACLLSVVSADAQVRTVEDWSTQQVGATGVPIGWEPMSKTVPLLKRALVPATNNDLQIVDGATGKALHLKSNRDHPMIVKGLGGLGLDLAQTPVLTWRWRVDVLPRGADVGARSRSDSAAALHVVWSAQDRTIGYTWDETRPVGSHVKSPKLGGVLFYIVTSGKARPGEWVSVRRDLVADYTEVYGKEPPGPPDQIVISIDSNDTKSTAESYIGPIAFRPR